MPGFDGRMFLLDSEHETYLRRMPVRYIKHPKSTACFICGEPATQARPFESAHRIPFTLGVRKFKLTPDYLDSKDNIVTAHRGACNKAAELSEADILELITKKPPEGGLL